MYSTTQPLCIGVALNRAQPISNGNSDPITPCLFIATTNLIKKTRERILTSLGKTLRYILPRVEVKIPRRREFALRLSRARFFPAQSNRCRRPACGLWISSGNMSGGPLFSVIWTISLLLGVGFSRMLGDFRGLRIFLVLFLVFFFQLVKTRVLSV